jgi:hypothetical protein
MAGTELTVFLSPSREGRGARRVTFSILDAVFLRKAARET